MAKAMQDRQQAVEYPEDDVIRVLMVQHARIRELIDEVERSRDEQRREAFEELRALMIMHEVGEDEVLRPLVEEGAEPDLIEVLHRVERLDQGDVEFARALTELRSAVDAHAARLEGWTFPLVLESWDLDRRRLLGRRMAAVEQAAPTRPHPGAAGEPTSQWSAGPAASLVDRAVDALAARN